MKGHKRFLPLALLGMIIISLAAVSPTLSDTGALRFYDPADPDEDKQWASQGGQIGLEVKDPDLDMASKLVNLPNQDHPDCEECVPAELVTLNNQKTFYLEAIPVLDSGVARGNVIAGNTDGFVNKHDVRLVDEDGIQIPGVVVDRLGRDGRVDLGSPYTGSFYAIYWGWNIGDTGEAVTVKSQAYPKGIAVKLTETRSNSGVFRLVVNTHRHHTDDESSPPTLEVGKNDVITLTYNDEDPDRSITKTLKVESTPPSFSIITPEHGSADRSEPVIEFDVSDDRSGIAGEDHIWVILAIDADADGIVEQGGEYEFQVSETPKGDVDEINGVFSAIQGLPSHIEIGGDVTIYWWALAEDSAGNLAVLDRQPRIDGRDNPCYPLEFPRGELAGKDIEIDHDVAGCQPYMTRIDNTGPVVLRMRTGAWWDPSKSGDDKTEYDPTKAKNTSILVVFDEAIDSSSVQNTDFRVDGNIPLEAEVFSGRGDYVFLTVPPMAADAQPEIEVKGSILDIAGNHVRTGDDDEDDDDEPSTPTPVPTPTATTTPFELLTTVIRESDRIQALSDELADSLSNLLAEYLITPTTTETPETVRTRLLTLDPALANNSVDYLIAVLNEARRIQELSDTLASALSDLLIEELIAPATGETADQIKERLSAQ